MKTFVLLKNSSQTSTSGIGQTAWDRPAPNAKKTNAIDKERITVNLDINLSINHSLRSSIF
jgi:hypothetical protein